MQANLDGQSRSTLHSGFSAMTAKGRIRKNLMLMARKGIWSRFSFSSSFFNPYVLHKWSIRLQSMEVCKHMSPDDWRQCKLHLEHKGFSHTNQHIPCQSCKSAKIGMGNLGSHKFELYHNPGELNT